MLGKYILDGHNPVLCEDLVTWAQAFEKSDRHVARTAQNDIVVSTIFLGIDYNFGGGPPLLFETMIFGGEHDRYCKRYPTWEEAEGGHKTACVFAFGQLKVVNGG